VTDPQRPCDHWGGHLLCWRGGCIGPGKTQQKEQQDDWDEQGPHGYFGVHRKPTMLGEDQQEQQQDEWRE
jgi:hypothetical protein